MVKFVGCAEVKRFCRAEVRRVCAKLGKEFEMKRRGDLIVERPQRSEERLKRER